MKQFLGELVKPLLRALRVESVTELGSHFRLIEVSGPALAGARCEPGDKVQLMLDGNLRTYSPFAFDAESGKCSLLAFVHGDGPASRWARAARAGDTLHAFGPRASLPLRELPAPAVLLGDETSLAVGRALSECNPASSVVLEVADVSAARAAAEAIGLRAAVFVTRTDEGKHLDELWRAAKAHPTKTGALILTGNARTIQALQRLAKAETPCFAVQKSKAYWAPGKRGLD